MFDIAILFIDDFLKMSWFDTTVWYLGENNIGKLPDIYMDFKSIKIKHKGNVP